jgi:structural maintenance of chromosome 4
MVRPDESDLARMKELEHGINRDRSNLTELEESSAKIQQEIQVLQEKILEIGGVRLRAQKAKIDAHKEQIEHLHDQISRSNNEKSRWHKASLKRKEELIELEKDLKSLQEEFETLQKKAELKTDEAAAVHEKLKQLEAQSDEKKDSLETLKNQLDQFKEEIDQVRSLELDLTANLKSSEKSLHQFRARQHHWTEKLESLRYSRILDDGTATEETLPVIGEEEFLTIDKSGLESEIRALESQLRDEPPNLSVIAEFKTKCKEYEDRVNEFDQITSQRDSARTTCEEWKKRRLDEFMTGFNIITQKLKEMYQLITLGGNAELELVDSLDPFSEGIVFSVMPPKKTWKNISNLSGGEKVSMKPFRHPQSNSV